MSKSSRRCEGRKFVGRPVPIATRVIETATRTYIVLAAARHDAAMFRPVASA